MMKRLPLPVLEDQALDGHSPGRSPFPIANRGKFIKQFSGPGEDSGVVCFKFWQLVYATAMSLRMCSIIHLVRA